MTTIIQLLDQHDDPDAPLAVVVAHIDENAELPSRHDLACARRELRRRGWLHESPSIVWTHPKVGGLLTLYSACFAELNP